MSEAFSTSSWIVRVEPPLKRLDPALVQRQSLTIRDGSQQQIASVAHHLRGWTSKLGELEDIDHALRDLEGDAYGSVVLVMKRPLPTAEM